MNHKKTPLSLSWLNDKSLKDEIEYSYYLYYIYRQINQIEREEKEESYEEAIIDFLNQPGWSLLRWNELDIKEDDTEESNRRINFRVAIGRRGKKRQKNLDKEGYHGCGSFDNVQRKIQVHYHNFIIALCNDALKTEYKKPRYSFKKINKIDNITVNFAHVLKLKNSLIKDLLNLEISDKCKNYCKDYNQKILPKIESTWLIKLFSMNYLELFKCYYNNEKPLKKLVFEGKEIVLSSKTKSFSYLLDKYPNLSEKIIDTSKTVYFSDENYGSHFSTTNISLINSREKSNKKV